MFPIEISERIEGPHLPVNPESVAPQSILTGVRSYPSLLSASIEISFKELCVTHVCTQYILSQEQMIRWLERS
jgi:hypothetical protein